MTQPGNAWHLPASEELTTGLFMRNPLYPNPNPNDPRASGLVSVYTGNQSDGGGGGAGNQLQDPQGTIAKYSLDGKTWTKVPLIFDRTIGSNKYFRADIPTQNLKVGAQVQYYFTLKYSDKLDTVIGVAGGDPTGWNSAVSQLKDENQVRPFVFTIGTQNQQKGFAYVPGTPKEIGQWSEPFALPEVGVHASLLRTEEVLYWGRRDSPEQSMNTVNGRDLSPVVKPATCTPFLLNLKTMQTRPAKQPSMPVGAKLNANLPKNADGTVNADLFCSGHAQLPDGRLFVAGGHLADGIGLDQSCIYDPMTDSWAAVPAKNGVVMGRGRWYPTVTNLPTGRVIVASGGYKDGDTVANNFDTQLFSYRDEGRTSELAPTAQLLKRDEFVSLGRTADRPLDLYPRMHVASSGIIYWISTFNIWALDMAADEKKWTRIGAAPGQEETDKHRTTGSLRDYGCSVMYDTDKVVFIGGGTPGTLTVDHLDLSDQQRIGRNPINPMMFPRRQHNATVLPDGSIFVTGGTQGNGRDAVGPSAGDVAFNDLRPSRPVHVAELWNASTRQWRLMAAEQIDRCYHATAVLLPDGRVLSAGGGEFQLNDGQGGQLPNAPVDSHRDAQIFSPPYLFVDGPRPQIKSVSTKVIECGTNFQITAADVDVIDTISLIGLASVTHSLNSGQRRMTLQFTQNGAALDTRAPPNARTCLPGYYMLFILNKKLVPSMAQIVQVVPRVAKQLLHREFTSQMVTQNLSPPSAVELRQTVRDADNGTRVELGITPTCPYGLSACWGGAYDALSGLPGVMRVDPIPHASGSTASVFLADNSLPDLALWTREFKAVVNEIYGLRGFEADVSGQVEQVKDGIALVLDGVTSKVALVPLDPNGKIQWDGATRQPRPTTDEEAAAYDTLRTAVAKVQSKTARVIGPLTQNDAGDYQLQVRVVDP